MSYVVRVELCRRFSIHKYIGPQKCIRLVGNCCVYQTVVIAFKITRVWWIRCLLTKKEVIRNLSMLPLKNYLINQTCIREHK